VHHEYGRLTLATAPGTLVELGACVAWTDRRTDETCHVAYHDGHMIIARTITMLV